MSANSEVDVANSSLAKLGDYRIISLNDNTREARLVKQQFYKIYKELLRAHPWKFAKVRTTLALLPTPPAFGFQFQYQLPVDCERVVGLNDYPSDDCPWTVEGGLLLTDMSGAGAIYISNAKPAGMWDSSFCEAFASKLAHDICYAITQSSTLKDQLLKEYNLKLSEARTFNAQEGAGDRVYATDWLVSRY